MILVHVFEIGACILIASAVKRPRVTNNVRVRRAGSIVGDCLGLLLARVGFVVRLMKIENQILRRCLRRCFVEFELLKISGDTAACAGLLPLSLPGNQIFARRQRNWGIAEQHTHVAVHHKGGDRRLLRKHAAIQCFQCHVGAAVPGPRHAEQHCLRIVAARGLHLHFHRRAGAVGVQLQAGIIVGVPHVAAAGQLVAVIGPGCADNCFVESADRAVGQGLDIVNFGIPIVALAEVKDYVFFRGVGQIQLELLEVCRDTAACAGLLPLSFPGNQIFARRKLDRSVAERHSYIAVHRKSGDRRLLCEHASIQRFQRHVGAAVPGSHHVEQHRLRVVAARTLYLDLHRCAGAVGVQLQAGIIMGVPHMAAAGQLVAVIGPRVADNRFIQGADRFVGQSLDIVNLSISIVALTEVENHIPRDSAAARRNIDNKRYVRCQISAAHSDRHLCAALRFAGNL